MREKSIIGRQLLAFCVIAFLHSLSRSFWSSRSLKKGFMGQEIGKSSLDQDVSDFLEFTDAEKSEG